MDMSLYKGCKKVAGNITNNTLKNDLADYTVSFDDQANIDDITSFDAIQGQLTSSSLISTLFSTIKKCLNYLNTELLSLKNDLSKYYPIGSIYLSVNNINPSTFIGGSWERWGNGRIPTGVNENDPDFSLPEKQGGTKLINLSHSHSVNNHTHSTNNCTLNINQIPSHNHWLANGALVVNNGNSATNQFDAGVSGFSSIYNSGWFMEWKKGTIWETQYAGGNQAHNHGSTGGTAPGTNAQLSSSQSIVQPYITCYMWKRVA